LKFTYLLLAPEAKGMAKNAGKKSLPAASAASPPLFTAKDALSLLAAIAITAICFFAFSHAQGLVQEWGYAGVFIISLLSSATVFLPLPGFAVVAAASAYLNPLLLGVAAGLGSGLGEITGYLAGFSGHDAIGRTKLFAQHKKLLAGYGPFAIFFLSFFPNPIFDIAGLAAGAMKMPMWKFLAATLAGKILRYVLFAYFSGAAIEWLF
jgi:membrane protein YqaA with SNARE-associated domain